jgi:hypothetical protein
MRTKRFEGGELMPQGLWEDEGFGDWTQRSRSEGIGMGDEVDCVDWMDGDDLAVNDLEVCDRTCVASGTASKCIVSNNWYVMMEGIRHCMMG